MCPEDKYALNFEYKMYTHSEHKHKMTRMTLLRKPDTIDK